MKEQFKKFLNEDQDPKAIEKISAKLADLLMKNEEIGYIGVQKKPAITVLPDSIVMTNKRIILCKPKNLGLSMDFVDYDWDDVGSAFVKENILGSQFSFSTKTDLVIDIDYIPKNQARKLYTYAKEQLDLLKNPAVENVIQPEQPVEVLPEIEIAETEEVIDYAEIMPLEAAIYQAEPPVLNTENTVELSQDELFAKLQNYKKLLDNGLILQGEYDLLKKEILSKM